MFLFKKKFRTLELELKLSKAHIDGIELALSVYCKQIAEILDQNQSIIDINKIVLDKLEEILKAKGLE